MYPLFMQEQVRLPEFLDPFAMNTSSLEYPPTLTESLIAQLELTTSPV